PGEMLHLANFSQNGIVGMSTIAYHKEVLLTSRRQTRWQDRFFGQGINPAGVLETDEDLDQSEVNEVEAQWNKVHGSVDNAHKAIIMQFGLKWKPISMKAQDVEIINQYNLTEKQICGIMRVPPQMIQNHDKSTFTNSEQVDLAFTKHCVRNWAERLEAV